MSLAQRAPARIVETWMDGERVVLKDENGRLFSVPVGTPGLAALLARGGPARGPSALGVPDIVDLLEAGVSEETIETRLEQQREAIALSNEDLIELRRAGAGDDFVRFLTLFGQGGVVLRSGYSRAPRTEAPQAAPPSAGATVPAPEPAYPYGYPYAYGSGGYGPSPGQWEQTHPEPERRDDVDNARRATRSVVGSPPSGQPDRSSEKSTKSIVKKDR